MRRALLAATALLALPATASAGSYSVAAQVAESEVGINADSIALAGGRVLWLERRGDRDALLAAGEDGVPRAIYSFPPVHGGKHFLGVVAQGDTAIVRRLVCADVNCQRNAAAETVKVDLATGAAADLRLARGPGCLGNVKLSGSVLAASSCERTGVVLDLADGTRRDLDGQPLAVAGDYVALRGRGEITDTLTVLNWRTGAALGPAHEVNLDARATEAALDADGTLAWIEQGIKVLRPGAAQPATVPLAGENSFVVQPALAQGRLAVRRWGELEENILQVSALDGSGKREVQGQHGNFGWAFDGTRLAWATQPCGQTVIQVWDTTTEPPAPANDHCIRARLAQPAARLKGSRLTLKLRCPKTPERGCAGDVKADFPGGASTGWYGYRVPAGTTRAHVLILRNRTRRNSNRGHVTLESAYGGARARTNVRIQSSAASP